MKLIIYDPHTNGTPCYKWTAVNVRFLIQNFRVTDALPLKLRIVTVSLAES